MTEKVSGGLSLLRGDQQDHGQETASEKMMRTEPMPCRFCGSSPSITMRLTADGDVLARIHHTGFFGNNHSIITLVRCASTARQAREDCIKDWNELMRTK